MEQTLVSNLHLIGTKCLFLCSNLPEYGDILDTSYNIEKSIVP